MVGPADEPGGDATISTALLVTTSKGIDPFSDVPAPRIAIDGEVYERPWGTWTFDVAPGKHLVEIWCDRISRRARQYRKITVDLAAGERKRLSYRVRPLFGTKLTVEPAVPTARVVKSG